MVVRMRKVLAIPGGVGTCASVLKLVLLVLLPLPLPGWCVPRFVSFSPEVLMHTVDQNSLNNRYASVGLQELFG